MYDNLGTQWASSIPAFLAAACTPMPFLFYMYGDTIRAHSKYAAQAKAITAQMLNQNGKGEKSPSTSSQADEKELEAGGNREKRDE